MMELRQIAEDIPVLVPLKDMDETPGPYSMSFGFDLKPLIRSIEKVGLINSPIVVRNREGKRDVVAGFRRILAFKSLKREKVPCRDLSEWGLSPSELLILNLYDNLTTRALNDVEKGMILKRLVLHVPREEILEHYMPLLDLPSRESNLHIFLKLEELDCPIRSSFAERRLSFQTIKALLGMDPESRTASFEWISKITLNFNQQSKFLEYTNDISIKEGKKITELLFEKQLSDLFEDQKLNNPQKAKQILGHLRTRRFPSLTRAEKTFDRRTSDLNLPEGVRVYHPPFFEGTDYRLELLFKGGKELKEKIDFLSKLEALKRIDDPWEEDS